MAWADLAGTLTAPHVYEQAEHAAMRALQLNPGDYIALANLGYIAECRGARRQAISYYEKSLMAGTRACGRISTDCARRPAGIVDARRHESVPSRRSEIY
jgi:Flp pilus assembly protein TadD